MADWVIYLIGGGTLLATLGYVWYTLRKGTLDAETVSEVTANNKELQDKLAKQDQAVVDAEYKRRSEEKKSNAKITTGSAAYDVLRGTFSDDPKDLN